MLVLLLLLMLLLLLLLLSLVLLLQGNDLARIQHWSIHKRDLHIQVHFWAHSRAAEEALSSAPSFVRSIVVRCQKKGCGNIHSK